MAVAWTDITNAQVAAGAAVTTALMTALRDNPEGIAQRASGAPKIFGVPYDYQEFTANGTWTKPSSAETGDVVYIEVIAGAAGGQGSGAGARGGGGGSGFIWRIDDIDDLPASDSVTVGAGGAGGSGTTGTAGGDSQFGSSGDLVLGARGGEAVSGATGRAAILVGSGSSFQEDDDGGLGIVQRIGGLGASANASNVEISSCTIHGGAGGGGRSGTNESRGGISTRGGHGGAGKIAGTGGDGFFPGGGGGAGPSDGGAGADGVVRVWCVKEE